MRKKILVMALIIAGAFSVGTVAQNKDSKDCPKKECTAVAKDCKKSACPFDGMNLTDAQKNQLKTLNTQMCDSRKEIKDKKIENAKEIKAGREAAQTKYNEGLKKILTPEQYTQYLEKQLNNKNCKKGDRYCNKKGNDCTKDKKCCDKKADCPKAKK